MTTRISAVERAKQLEEKARAKASAELAPANEIVARAAPTQIPLWPSNVRGMPNSLARSALFNVNRASAPREQYTKKEIASVDGTTITLKGEELRQDDADVFLEILHLARDTQISERVEFTGYAMLKMLGWDYSGKGYKRLMKTIERLQESTVNVSFEGKKKGFQGQLVRKFLWKGGDETETDGNTRWTAYIEPEIAHLFSHDDYTRLSREQRLRLKSELSKWLHSFYHTHAVPYAVSVRYIHQQCGSKAKSLAHFRVTLRRSLNELTKVGFLAEGYLDETDKVQVVRAKRTIPA
ncbi:RepB family plasmid replication initiator protein [Paraburkholderia sp. UCT31]|uniref:plasmid replication initiator TrfA n=1 Tax=Paraburkholderia sp. UCT31 TaxID=2615209 RepID=UPI0016565122|nr:plasmid replication initiator TrfA [Paraburkholderia sp. UCT31]MBC8738507.1 RepB family plasmid replication initiator protein [Paraburkholderia sp. UCT31]